MKRYNVVYENDADVISVCVVKAENLKAAKEYAQVNKPAVKCRTRVYLER